MTILEKEILFLVSRHRSITDTQIIKLYNSKKTFTRKQIKRTLRKMVNDYILGKFKTSFDVSLFKNEYVYYLNGSEILEGDELYKTLIGSEISIRLKIAGCSTKRYFRDVRLGDTTYDIYVLYTNLDGELTQILCDVAQIDESVENIDFNKYKNLSTEIKKTTIPFFQIPKILLVSSNKTNLKLKELLNEEKVLSRELSNVYYVDYKLNGLSKFLF